ncbi:MAG: hypothetical protein HGA76_00785, partial [Candidatus Firestonebacteria bacterium]|nr:hypothetical protein [Candidatus Firestonebacteria bacterium]
FTAGFFESIYPLSKIIPEKWVLSLPHGRSAVMRLSNVYGPRQSPKNVFNAFLGRLLGPAEEAVSFSDDTRDFISAAKAVQAIETAGRKLSAGEFSENEKFLIVSGKSTGMEALLNLVRKVLGRFGLLRLQKEAGRAESVPQKMPEVDTRKAEQLLGFDPRSDLEEGIQDMVLEVGLPGLLSQEARSKKDAEAERRILEARYRNQIPLGFNPGEKVKIKGVVMDVDGTITYNATRPPEGQNLEELVKCLRVGIPVLLISGSPISKQQWVKIYRNGDENQYFLSEQKFEEASLLERVIAPIRAELERQNKLAGQSGDLSALQHLTVKGIDGAETISFAEQGKEWWHLDEAVAIPAKDQCALGRALAVGYLKVLKPSLNLDERQQYEFDSALEGLRAAEDVLSVIQWLTTTTQKFGVETKFWLFNSEMVLKEKTKKIPASLVLKEAEAELIREGKVNIKDYALTFGGTFIKISRLEKTPSVQTWVDRLAGEGAVLGLGDTTTDDFLGKAKDPLYFAFFIGKALEMAKYPNLIIARDDRNHDNVAFQATGEILNKFREAVEKGLVFGSLKIFDNRYSWHDLLAADFPMEQMLAERRSDQPKEGPNSAGKAPAWRSLKQLIESRKREHTALPKALAELAPFAEQVWVTEENHGSAYFIKVALPGSDGKIEYAYAYLGSHDDWDKGLANQGHLFGLTYNKWAAQRPDFLYRTEVALGQWQTERKRLLNQPLNNLIKVIPDLIHQTEFENRLNDLLNHVKPERLPAGPISLENLTWTQLYNALKPSSSHEKESNAFEDLNWLADTYIGAYLEKKYPKLFLGRVPVHKQTVKDLPLWPVSPSPDLTPDSLRWMPEGGAKRVPSVYAAAPKISLDEIRSRLAKNISVQPPHGQLSLFGDNSPLSVESARPVQLERTAHPAPDVIQPPAQALIIGQVQERLLQEDFIGVADLKFSLTVRPAGMPVNVRFNAPHTVAYATEAELSSPEEIYRIYKKRLVELELITLDIEMAPLDREIFVRWYVAGSGETNAPRTRSSAPLKKLVASILADPSFSEAEKHKLAKEILDIRYYSQLSFILEMQRKELESARIFLGTSEWVSLETLKNSGELPAGLRSFSPYASRVWVIANTYREGEQEEIRYFVRVALPLENEIPKFAYLYLGARDDVQSNRSFSWYGTLFNWSFSTWKQKHPDLFNVSGLPNYPDIFKRTLFAQEQPAVRDLPLWPVTEHAQIKFPFLSWMTEAGQTHGPPPYYRHCLKVSLADILASLAKQKTSALPTLVAVPEKAAALKAESAVKTADLSRITYRAAVSEDFPDIVAIHNKMWNGKPGLENLYTVEDLENYKEKDPNGIRVALSPEGKVLGAVFSRRLMTRGDPGKISELNWKEVTTIGGMEKWDSRYFFAISVEESAYIGLGKALINDTKAYLQEHDPQTRFYFTLSPSMYKSSNYRPSPLPTAPEALAAYHAQRAEHAGLSDIEFDLQFGLRAGLKDADKEYIRWLSALRAQYPELNDAEFDAQHGFLAHLNYKILGRDGKPTFYDITARFHRRNGAKIAAIFRNLRPDCEWSLSYSYSDGAEDLKDTDFRGEGLTPGASPAAIPFLARMVRKLHPEASQDELILHLLPKYESAIFGAVSLLLTFGMLSALGLAIAGWTLPALGLKFSFAGMTGYLLTNFLFAGLHKQVYRWKQLPGSGGNPVFGWVSEKADFSVRRELFAVSALKIHWPYLLGLVAFLPTLGWVNVWSLLGPGSLLAAGMFGSMAVVTGLTAMVLMAVAGRYAVKFHRQYNRQAKQIGEPVLAVETGGNVRGAGGTAEIKTTREAAERLKQWLAEHPIRASLDDQVQNKPVRVSVRLLTLEDREKLPAALVEIKKTFYYRDPNIVVLALESPRGIEGVLALNALMPDDQRFQQILVDFQKFNPHPPVMEIESFVTRHDAFTADKQFRYTGAGSILLAVAAKAILELRGPQAADELNSVLLAQIIKVGAYRNPKTNEDLDPDDFYLKAGMEPLDKAAFEDHRNANAVSKLVGKGDLRATYETQFYWSTRPMIRFIQNAMLRYGIKGMNWLSDKDFITPRSFQPKQADSKVEIVTSLTDEEIKRISEKYKGDGHQEPGRVPSSKDYGSTLEAVKEKVFPEIVQKMPAFNTELKGTEVMLIGPGSDAREIIQLAELFPGIKTIHVVEADPQFMPKITEEVNAFFGPVSEIKIKWHTVNLLELPQDLSNKIDMVYARKIFDPDFFSSTQLRQAASEIFRVLKNGGVHISSKHHLKEAALQGLPFKSIDLSLKNQPALAEFKVRVKSGPENERQSGVRSGADTAKAGEGTLLFETANTPVTVPAWQLLQRAREVRWLFLLVLRLGFDLLNVLAGDGKTFRAKGLDEQETTFWLTGLVRRYFRRDAGESIRFMPKVQAMESSSFWQRTLGKYSENKAQEPPSLGFSQDLLWALSRQGRQGGLAAALRARLALKLAEQICYYRGAEFYRQTWELKWADHFGEAWLAAGLLPLGPVSGWMHALLARIYGPDSYVNLVVASLSPDLIRTSNLAQHAKVGDRQLMKLLHALVLGGDENKARDQWTALIGRIDPQTATADWLFVSEAIRRMRQVEQVKISILDAQGNSFLLSVPSAVFNSPKAKGVLFDHLPPAWKPAETMDNARPKRSQWFAGSA